LSYDENVVGRAAASSLDCLVRMSLKSNYDIVFFVLLLLLILDDLNIEHRLYNKEKGEEERKKQ
jgi:hypothetical protein